MFTQETQCTTCDHRKVCSLTAQFLKAQEAVNDVFITLSSDSELTAMKYLRDFEFIEPVKLHCKYYSCQTGSARIERGDGIYDA